MFRLQMVTLEWYDYLFSCFIYIFKIFLVFIGKDTEVIDEYFSSLNNEHGAIGKYLAC